MTDASTAPGVATRRLAIAALVRIDVDGAFANLLVPKMLDESGLDERDRAFVTELVYGSVRMRRAVDFLADRFVDRAEVDPRARAALRIGAYQLHFLDTPAHAAVDATVAATPKRARGFVNAILRRIADADVEWPNDAIRLSYPDWILTGLGADLGDRAIPVLEAMNRPLAPTTRPDGYIQDPSSTAVAELVDVGSGEIVIDLCAAPGGKATHIAHRGATVIGVDLHEHRVGLIRTSSERTGAPVLPVVADGTAPPFRSNCADAVLVDAPCSGLGALRRRPDARWRIRPDDVHALAGLQFGLVLSARRLLRPGGLLVFSVCTLTAAESTAIDDRVAAELPILEPIPLDAPWEPWGRGGRLLPDIHAGDGMAAFAYRLPG